MFSFRLAISFLLVAAGGAVELRAVEEISSTAPDDSPGGFNAANAAIKSFELPKGFKCETAAADPLLANPVAFSIDEQGRFYVVETFRLHHGVPDIRGRKSWLDTELASKSVAERIGYTRYLEPNHESWWTNHSDRVSLVWDSDGDGRCDQSKIFATGFNQLADGIASGVLARHGNVYFADIPNLWLLRDTNADQVADTRKILSSGYGVRYGFTGHDLHGLILGPDGRLYYSIGDRGAHITLPNRKVLDNSECGAVYRCELDGSNLEIFYTGLRNPQELAFDDHGNLWTVDNNSDAGDPARVVYVAEGGDSGWRIGWQFLEHPLARGSWLGERICYEDFPGRAAYALPPVSSKVGNGPSGLAFDPGVGLPPEWRGRFFLANFSGNPNSGIYAFKVRAKGAGFELEQNDRFWWNFLPTDIDFGYDGCIYASDWINGWDGTGKGRLYRLFQPEQRDSPAATGLKKLFADGFRRLSTGDLAKILAHQDRRVRQEAQFELVARSATNELAEVAATGPTLFARLHAIWGLGQLERAGKRLDLKNLLADPQPEVRAQTAKILGDAKDDRLEKQLVKLLADAEPRVRYFAAQSLGKLGNRRSAAPVLGMLRESGGDPWLRHAGVMALVACANELELAALAKDESVNVRLAAVVALRRSASARLQDFLTDSDPRVVAEAARAINDLPVEPAMPALASVADQPAGFAEMSAGTPEQPSPRDAILRRVVNANRRLGTLTSQIRIASILGNEKLPQSVRSEAIAAFDDWAKPDGKDRVSGLWRQITARPEPDFSTFEAVLVRAMAGNSSAKIKTELLALGSKRGLKSFGEPAFALFKNEATPVKARVAALEFLGGIDSPKLNEAINLASGSRFDELRVAALKFATKSMRGDKLVAVFVKLLDAGTLHERQGAYALLAEMKHSAADDLLGLRLDSLLMGQIAGDVQLDLIEAAAKRGKPAVKDKLGQFFARRTGRQGAGQFVECLTGGDAERGKKIFREHPQATCLRCHKISGEGGDAAPDLTHVGFRGNREFILESITFPNAKIATGFESAQVVLNNGLVAAGIVKRDTDTELDLYSLEDGLVTVKKSDIKTRNKTMSSMPENMREILTRREIRDLVEYLAGLK
ncbi:MAG: c-type cytochrome [Pedosphaera sp.]|nr:c-type cytochrome [Pedosphaera sp.]